MLAVVREAQGMNVFLMQTQYESRRWLWWWCHSRGRRWLGGWGHDEDFLFQMK